MKPHGWQQHLAGTKIVQDQVKIVQDQVLFCLCPHRRPREDNLTTSEFPMFTLAYGRQMKQPTRSHSVSFFAFVEGSSAARRLHYHHFQCINAAMMRERFCSTYG